MINERPETFRWNWQLVIVPFVFSIMSAGASLSNPQAIIAFDTSTYLEFSIFRPFLYPGFLHACGWLFGPHAMTAASLIQIGLGAGAAIFVASVIAKRFHPSLLALILTQCIILFPYIGVFNDSVRRALSEGLAYPFFWIAVTLLFFGARDARKKSIVLGLVALALAVATRQQMAFLIPVTMLAGICVLFFRRNAAGVAVLLLVGPVAGLLAVSTANRTAHWVHDGHFQTGSFAGLQIVTPLVYALAEHLDEPAIKKMESLSDAERKLLQDAIVHARKHRATFEENRRTPLDPETGRRLARGQAHFLHSYLKILHFFRREDLSPYYSFLNPETRFDDLTYEDNHRVERSFLAISKEMITARPVTLLRFHLRDSAAWREGGKYFSILIAVLLVIGLYQTFRYRNEWSLLITFAAFCSLANHALIIIFEPLLGRYVLYTDSVILVILVLALDRSARAGGE